MTTFSDQPNDKNHVDNIPRGSAKMDPYTKSAMSIDAVKQVEKTIKRKPIFAITSGLGGVNNGIAGDIFNHIYGATTPDDRVLEWAKAYCKKDVEDTFRCIGVFFPEDRLTDFYLKQRLNESVNKEITRQFRKDGKRK
nr:MAG TPA: hypothetical protein [Caudoviricetes sp.]